MPATLQTRAIGQPLVSTLTVIDVMAKSAPAPTDFGTYLERLAAANGYNQAQLARTAGVNQTQLSRAFLNVTIPSIDTMRKIAPLLNVRLGDLMIRAGVATATELGTAGSPPPPLPPVIKDILTLLGPHGGLTEKEKRMVQAAMRRTLESWLEWHEATVEDRGGPPRRR